MRKFDGVQTEFDKAKRIYSAHNKGENCNLLVTPEAHYWCYDLIWLKSRRL